MGQNTRKDPRAKVLSMTVRYRSATLGEFIEHHSYDVSRGGMFIKTPSPFPAGTLLKFEVRIAEEQRVMQGVGRVVWKRDVAEPNGEPAGMGIKFLKIDEASRAVIERLLGSREGGTLGAFDRSPGDDPMFPGSSSSSLPPPEDRTVMKPASELLDEALRKTGADVPPQSASGVRAEPSSAGSAGSAGSAENTSSAQADGKTGPTPSASALEKDAPASTRIPSLESLDKTQRSPLEPTAAPSSKGTNGAPMAAASAAASDEEGGGGRAFFLFLAVAAVAAGIWILTKKSGPPEMAPPPEPEAEIVKPSAPLAEPSAPQLELAPSADVVPDASAPLAPEVPPLPSATESAAPSAPVPSAAPPVVVKKPKTVTPTAPAAPKPTAAPEATSPPTSGAAAPTAAPSSPSEAKPTPAPAPAPTPPAAENPY